jgi:hypothetical protein
VERLGSKMGPELARRDEVVLARHAFPRLNGMVFGSMFDKLFDGLVRVFHAAAAVKFELPMGARSLGRSFALMILILWEVPLGVIVVMVVATTFTELPFLIMPRYRHRVCFRIFQVGPESSCRVEAFVAHCTWVGPLVPVFVAQMCDKVIGGVEWFVA